MAAGAAAAPAGTPPAGGRHTLVARIREIWADDDADGRRRTGRPTLCERLAAEEKDVRAALEEIRRQDAASGRQQPPGRRQPAGRRVLPFPGDGPPTEELAAVTADDGRQDEELADAGRQDEELAASRRQPPPATQPRGARAVSWAAFLVGIGVSVAGNIGHELRPPAGLAPTAAAWWTPDPWGISFAIAWPVLLMLAVECMTRVRWPAGFWWLLARYAATGLVALVAAWMSYSHLAALLAATGEPWWSAHLGPLAPDGLMVVSGFALLAIGPPARRAGHQDARPGNRQPPGPASTRQHPPAAATT